MKIKLLTLFLSFMAVLLPTEGLAEKLRIGSSKYSFHGEIYAQLSVKGEKTSGVTFVVHDVYFDGYQLTLSITQVPNSAGYMVYNNVLGDYEINYAEEGIINALPLGAYCETVVRGKDGEILPMSGVGQRNGSAYVRTDSYCFLPDEVQDVINVTVVCGVMEKPGQVVGKMQTLKLAIPIQNQAETRSITLVNDKGKPPYLDEIFIAETAEVAEIFAFFSHNVSGDCICPIAFVNTEGEVIESTPYTDNSGDPANDRGYTYHAIRKKGSVHFICVLDLHSQQKFSINLENGTIQKIE